MSTSLQSIGFLPNLQILEQIDHGFHRITLRVQPMTTAASCPACGTSSRRVHGSHWRSLKDVACFGRPTVLLVQSEPAARSDVAISLNKTGFNVIEAASTGEAWTTLEARPDIQVLLTDLDVSSGADGLEFAHKVHDRWPSIGLVIISGQVRHLRPDDVPGGGCFLPRPVPAETLLHEVKVAAHQIAA